MTGYIAYVGRLADKQFFNGAGAPLCRSGFVAMTADPLEVSKYQSFRQQPGGSLFEARLNTVLAGANMGCDSRFMSVSKLLNEF